MKTRYLFLLLTIFIIPAMINAQAIAYYSGTVRNTDNQPVENVSVAAAGVEQNILTDANGNFLLPFNTLIYDSLTSIGTNYVRMYFFHPDYNTTTALAAIEQGDSLTGNTIILENKTSGFIVSGKITYENNAPIRAGGIDFINADGEVLHNYYTSPDAEGNYSVTLPAGYYFVRCKAVYKDEVYPPSWAQRFKYYLNADNLEDADLLEVFADVHDLNFVHKDLQLGYISGKVVDAQTQQPLDGVGISVTAAPKTDSLFIGTDAEGNFRIKVFEGEYTIFAYKPGYNLQYYKNVSTLFEALPVVVTASNPEVTGINFSLEPYGSEQNSVSGYVYDSGTGLPVPDVEVYAIPFGAGSWSKAVTAPVNNTGSLRKTDNNGAYNLKKIKSGSYVLLFHKPGYLNTFNGQTVEWEKASILVLSGSTQLEVNVNLKKALSFGGEISGLVTSLQDGVSGTLISALDEEGTVIATGVSTYDGNYVLPFVDQGNYTLKASHVGNATVAYDGVVNINLITNLSVDDINFKLDRTSGVDYNSNPEGYKLDQNYPNPFNPSTSFSFSIAEQGLVSFKIYDVLGNEIATLVNEVKPAGTYKIKFDAGSITSGVYFYQIKSGNFTEARKMLLMK